MLIIWQNAARRSVQFVQDGARRLARRFPLCLSIAIGLSLTAPAFGADGSPDISDITQFARRSWTDKEGLPGSHVWVVVQDVAGYIWLGTNGGLVRFDGVRFVENVGAPDLPVATVRALCVARDGSLWIGFGGAGGVSRMKDGAVTNYQLRDGIPPRLITNLVEGRDGSIWASSSAGLSRFRNRQWEFISGTMDLPRVSVSALHVDGRGAVWVGTSRGIFRLFPDRRLFEQVSKEVVSAFAEDSHGGLWVTDPNVGVRGLSYDDASVPPLHDAVSRLQFDSLGNLWIGTQAHGVFRLSKSSTGRRRLQRLDVENGLTSNTVWSIMTDREGSIWVGTQNGLNQLSQNTIASLPKAGDPPMSTYVRAVVGFRSSVWAGTADGLYRFRGTTRVRFDEKEGLPSSSIRALLVHPSGNLWVATGGGVSVFDGQNFHDLRLQTEIELNQVNAIAADSRGDVWLNDTAAGLWHWRQGHLEPVPMPAALANTTADAIFADREDRIWFGLVEGGCAIYENSQFRVYQPEDGLARGPVTSFFEDRDGSMWISAVNGLTRVKDGHLLTATRSNGLPGNVLTGVIGDEEDGLWVGSNAGILRVLKTEFDRLRGDSTRTLHITLFASPEGLNGNPVTLGSPEVTQDSDGRIWFPTTAGVAIVDPRFATKPRIAPAAKIESAFVNDKPVAITPGSALAPNPSRVEIDFTALSFLAPSRILFRYRLDNFDTDWVDAGRSRRAVYTSLPPGTYRFRVSAANDDVWSDAQEDWTFTIAPKYYQTEWFRAVFVLGAVLLAALVWQIRSRQVRSRFLLVMEERARVGREIHDTLLQAMTGFALEVHSASVALRTTQEPVRRSLLQLRDKIQESIREARQSIWDLKLTNPIKEEDQQLVVALRKTSENIVGLAKDVQFEFVATGTPYKKPELDEQLFRLGQEAIRNAVAHAKASRIRVELSYQRDSIALRVTDNGCGFELTDNATRSSLHWGLAIMEERARKIGAEFRLVTSPGEGTMVEAIAKL